MTIFFYIASALIAVAGGTLAWAFGWPWWAIITSGIGAVVIAYAALFVWMMIARDWSH